VYIWSDDYRKKVGIVHFKGSKVKHPRDLLGDVHNDLIALNYEALLAYPTTRAAKWVCDNINCWQKLTNTIYIIRSK
jgi:hypothetical protein